MICKSIELTPAYNTIRFRKDNKYAELYTYHRGGCLFAGSITFKNLINGEQKEISSCMSPLGFKEGVEVEWMENLWNKHLGG